MYDCMHGVPRCRFLISIACMLNMLYGDLYCMWWVCGGFRNGAAAVFSIYMILMQFQVCLFSMCVLEFHASRLPGSNCLVSSSHSCLSIFFYWMPSIWITKAAVTSAPLTRLHSLGGYRASLILPCDKQGIHILYFQFI